MENEAILYCQKHQQLTFQYLGNDTTWFSSIGKIQVLEDMNCCAPTQNVLFSFSTKDRRKVMSASEFMDFIKACKILENTDIKSLL